MAKLSKRQRRAYEDIIVLQEERRKNVMKMVIAGVIILVLVVGKGVLDWFGLFPQASTYISMGIWAIAIVLAFFFAGPASINLTKSRDVLDQMFISHGITKEDLEAYKKGELE